MTFNKRVAVRLAAVLLGIYYIVTVWTLAPIPTALKAADRSAEIAKADEEEARANRDAGRAETTKFFNTVAQPVSDNEKQTREWLSKSTPLIEKVKKADEDLKISQDHLEYTTEKQKMLWSEARSLALSRLIFIPLALIIAGCGLYVALSWVRRGGDASPDA